MMFAIRNDGLGFRSINDVNDVLIGEHILYDIPQWPDTGSSRDDIERLRLVAYSNPITGSDRYFAEASRLTAMKAPQENIEAAISAGIARAAEIAAMYPWPEE